MKNNSPYCPHPTNQSLISIAQIFYLILLEDLDPFSPYLPTHLPLSYPTYIPGPIHRFHIFYQPTLYRILSTERYSPNLYIPTHLLRFVPTYRYGCTYMQASMSIQSPYSTCPQLTPHLFTTDPPPPPPPPPTPSPHPTSAIPQKCTRPILGY